MGSHRKLILRFADERNAKVRLTGSQSATQPPRRTFFLEPAGKGRYIESLLVLRQRGSLQLDPPAISTSMAVRSDLVNALACLLVILAGGIWLTDIPSRRAGGAWTTSLAGRHPEGESRTSSFSVVAAAKRIDDAIATRWSPGLEPAPLTDDLQIARRLTVTLHGRIPSLEEIRWFESRPPTTRLDEWLERLLRDRCFADYFAERFARGLVHSKGSDFPFPFRRDCFTNWLTEEIAQNRRYDEIARSVITATGVWTNDPAANFFTAHEVDPVRLTTRTTRMFLGLRLDCAQCHNHPFAEWKQEDFHGLAAFYGGAQLAKFTSGVHDIEQAYSYAPAGQEDRVGIGTRVPFAAELLPLAGNDRDRLATWITHSKNPYFSRALVNRVWALMFGVGLSEPIDDLVAPKKQSEVLDIAAEEFTRSGFDLRQLIRTIAATQAFRRESAFQGAFAEDREAVLAAFPSTRLRPEQLARAMLQTLSFAQHDYAISGNVRNAESQLIEELGDKHEEEMSPREANLAQRLAVMNTRSLYHPLESMWGGAAGELGFLSASPRVCVEVAFLVCLTRQPTTEEQQLCTERLTGLAPPERMQRLQDLFWVLTNSTEFSWLH